MADPGRHEATAGDPDSRRSLWEKIRHFFGADDEPTLREQIEEAIDEHEDEHSASEEGDLVPLERQMLRNLLAFSDLDADDTAIPRGAIIALPNTATWDEVVAAFAEHGHSRIPVYRETLDTIIGMILMKDVFAILAGRKAPPRDWTTLMRQPLYVPQARRALELLADMRASRVHLAVVVDEYSGTDGIVTLEDLVEEIVGEVEDEHDDARQELLRPLEDGSWDADAHVELEEVAEKLNWPLAEEAESVDTLGGLAFLLAEQVPSVGAVLQHPAGWRIEVTAGDERHVTRLRLHPPANPA